jgi:DNA recombination protein RmuC
MSFFILGLLLGLLLPLLFVWVYWRKAQARSDQSQASASTLQVENARLTERSSRFEAELAALRLELQQTRQQLDAAAQAGASERERARNLEERLSQEKQELLTLQTRLKTEFENLANRILEEKSAKFSQQNQSSLDQLLKPFAEKLADLRKTVESAHLDESKQRASLGEQIKSLTELNRRVTNEAHNLTQALKGQSQTQGAWGEFILETVLDRSGLTKGVEYSVQTSLLSEEQQRLRPDVVINLPEAKNLVIDSKLSLVAYERFCSAEGEPEKAVALKAHLDSLRQHLKDLSAKKYQTLYQINTPDFVLMFIPLESAFSLAMQHDHELFNEAFERNIVIVTPTTLLATLRTVSNLWKMENQNKNALEIGRKAGDLLDKFADFCSDLEKIGEQIKRTEVVHEEAMKKLKTGRGNLLNRATEIQKLGAKATKALPEAESAEEEG